MSSSKSKSSTDTDNFDNRAGAEGGEIGIALGGGGTITVIDEFPEEVGTFANKVLDVITGSQQLQEQTTAAAVKSVETIASREQSSALFAQDILEKVTPIALIGGAVILGVFYFKKGKR